MQSVTTIGFDIAKSVFQVHGIGGEGEVVIQCWPGAAGPSAAPAASAEQRRAARHHGERCGARLRAHRHDAARPRRSGLAGDTTLPRRDFITARNQTSTCANLLSNKKMTRAEWGAGHGLAISGAVAALA
jgi:hypothetical protein